MKVVALVSGGKDSWYNIIKCIENGHEVICLANLRPKEAESEPDSYMYQSVGHNIVQLQSKASNIPLFQRVINGDALCKDLDYKKTEGDEVEDMYLLISDIIRTFPEIKGVSVGAVQSEYQKRRVENICNRLNLFPLHYLWNLNQAKLFDEIISSGIVAVIAKCATEGLKEEHLGKTLVEVKDVLCKLNDKYMVNICGEGGEYETIVIDCPLFQQKIIFDEISVVRDKECFYNIYKSSHLELKIL